MGLLVDGQWHNQWYDTKSSNGKFVRSEAQFRNWITADGQAGPTGKAGFKAEAGRYHLYVSLACPWAHRTLIFRELKGLQSMIDISVVNSLMAEQGWTFKPGPGVIKDTVNHVSLVYELYTLADPTYSGRVTVPILWDKQQQTIVSNESADIIRMFNSAFDGVGASEGDYYPEHAQDEINEVNDWIYRDINNGVYRAGFATTQAAYEGAVDAVFEALDKVELRLRTQRYLLGKQLTEADWRLFTTLIRFDAAYVGHFKCNKKRIADYPSLSNYVRDLYQHEGIASTVDIDYIKAHYYGSHETINPTRIIPVGPVVDFMQAHDRSRFA
ncbi:glutathione S-transferase family protein [Psychromonas sp. SP041]|uniref:glutathione S-transferase family protein n=1 Tax=Psychromonas sp. SP041 TaxID=1365007 RepID=UPI00040AA212|nr:glutathione S-transferase family protein [Psychromonas sp. SP041]